MTSNPLHALQFAYHNTSWEANLQTLLSLLETCEPNAFCLAPELCLTAYPYESMQAASDFSHKALQKLLPASKDKQIGLTLVIEEKGAFYNRFMLLEKEKIIYTQDKAKLFALGDEQTYFSPGKEEAIQCFTCNDGTKVGVLICFELRFTTLWEQLKGADIIFVPAYWGLPRKSHYEALTRALAIANQCYVIAANSTDSDMCASSAIISPFGEVTQEDTANKIDGVADSTTIKTMRRYINIGL